MNDFKSIIKLFSEKKISYDAFNRCWIEMYNVNHLSQSFSEEDQDLLEEIHEKIEYTIENPGEDRQYGYITPEELIEWLKEKKILE